MDSINSGINYSELGLIFHPGRCVVRILPSFTVLSIFKFRHETAQRTLSLTPRGIFSPDRLRTQLSKLTTSATTQLRHFESLPIDLK